MSVFHSKPVDVERPAVAVSDELIPLSHLALDLEVPAEGWPMFLGRRAITIRPDSLGRDSIDGGAAKRLFDEQREVVLRQAALRKVAEQAAVEQDQAFRASIGQGVTAAALNGMSYAEAMHEAELASKSYRPRASVAADLLDNGGRGMVFHPFHNSAEE